MEKSESSRQRLERHVAASEIRQLIAEKPKANGVTSPRKDPYDVLLVKADGKYSVYKHYN